MIRGNDFRSVGRPGLGLGIGLIATILDMARSGWKQVLASGEVGADSREPEIAGRLGREMIAEKARRNLSFPRFEEEVGTRSSPDVPKPEGRIDLKVIYSFKEEEYFGMECKRVSGNRGDGLARLYVEEGVLRFVKGKYSPGHEWAAMIGFVIDGQVCAAVEIVSEAVLARSIEVALCQPWAVEKRFGQQPHMYCTGHTQGSRRNSICILHLFLGVN